MVDCGGNTNRFVCPNDRQLALRAKLRTGWSVKTGSMGYQNSTGRSNSTGSLDKEEQAAILEVIHRAEQLELREQERVGRLVDRLEHMRRNALGRSASQCLLCGDHFGLLGAHSVPCLACHKLVCQKCAIEASTTSTPSSHSQAPTANAGNRGGSAGGRTESGVRVGSPGRGGKVQSGRQHNGKDQWLCKICAETREMWKKSGAWFFKGLPKYILPTQGITTGTGLDSRRSPGRQTPSPRPGQSIRSTLDEDSSSEEEKRGFLSSSDRRNSHTDNSISPYDTSPHYPSPLSDPREPRSPGVYSRQTSSTDSQRSLPSVSHPFTPSNNGTSLNNQGQQPPVTPVNSNININAVGMMGSGSVVGSSDLQIMERSWEDESSGHLGDPYRRDSVASRSMSEWTWSEDRASPSAGSVTSAGAKLQDDSTRPLDSTTATIELTLSYDSIRDTLHSTVHRVKNLQPMDINGLADPFCKLNILPEGKLSTRLRTKTVHKTRNPEFNESLTFYEISESDLLKKALHVLVLDDDKYGHDYMGEVKMSLAALRVQRSISMTVALERTLPDDCSLGPDTTLPSWFEDPWSRGQILISLCYSTRRRSLLVTIIRCANLLPMDNNGFSDPFVKMHLKPDPHHRKHKTSIKWKNLNPYYNEEFPFETRPNELSTQSLYITVWDKDYGKSNDYLGGLILGGAGSKGRRLKHWLDMIRYPDHRHEYWHSLTEDTLSD